MSSTSISDICSQVIPTPSNLTMMELLSRKLLKFLYFSQPKNEKMMKGCHGEKLEERVLSTYAK